MVGVCAEQCFPMLCFLFMFNFIILPFRIPLSVNLLNAAHHLAMLIILLLEGLEDVVFSFMTLLAVTAALAWGQLMYTRIIKIMD